MNRNRKNNRLKDYDYSKDGYYYVTICTENQKEYFGKIRNNNMILNEYGVALTECWRAIPSHFDYVGLDEFIIMPNHIHGILIINTVGNRHACSFSAHEHAQTDGKTHGSDHLKVSDKTYAAAGNRHACSLQRNHEKLPVIIGTFKSAVTKKINSMNPNFIFGWQKSYYDRVIRDEQELFNVRQYIMNNPLKADLYNKETLSWI